VTATGHAPSGVPRQGNTSPTCRGDFVNPQRGKVTERGDSNAYGRHVSGAMESRAAVFTSSPQAVEVYQAGAWWSGELLGWRHDGSGACEVWVRVVVGGREESAWTDLADLRPPERHLTLAPEPGRVDSRLQQQLPTGQVISAIRGGVVGGDPATTAALPMVRDLAPEPASTARPVAPVRTGGRRRAPEDGNVQAAPAAKVPVPPGRHRAPADEGRHRAADTGVMARVEERRDAPAEASADHRSPARQVAGAIWSAPAACAPRPEESFRRAEVCGAEPDLLTRPMRLSDHVPHSRRPRLDGSLSGV
jgi:hypothetical protein